MPPKDLARQTVAAAAVNSVTSRVGVGRRGGRYVSVCVCVFVCDRGPVLKYYYYRVFGMRAHTHTHT